MTELRKKLFMLCNHRSCTGSTDYLQYNEEAGTYCCTICGSEFHPLKTVDYDEAIKNYNTNDILNSFKLVTYNNRPVFNIVSRCLGKYENNPEYVIPEELFDICIGCLKEEENH